MIERYSSKEINKIWEQKYNLWLLVELTVCRIMEEEGIIPEGIYDKVKSVKVNKERILEIEEKVKHDVIAFLTHIEEQVGEDSRYIHFGLTSSDVLDTTFAMQLVQVGNILLNNLNKLLKSLKKRALELKNIPMVGRTHGIHAQIITAGLPFVSFYSEMKRNKERLENAINNISYGKISGAVGIYGIVSPELERKILYFLNLKPEQCATQIVPRDRHAEYFNVLSLIACSIERVAVQIRNLQRTEIGEVSEYFSEKQKGSSAMPHKKNPVLSENLCGLARLVKSYSQTILDNVALYHERDISHSSNERIVAPDCTELVNFMICRLTNIIDNLIVYPEKMKKNIEIYGSILFSEKIMLQLITAGLSRQKAYELVQKHVLSGNFSQLLKEDEEITRYIGTEIEYCFDLNYHLKYVDDIYERVFG